MRGLWRAGPEQPSAIKSCAPSAPTQGPSAWKPRWEAAGPAVARLRARARPPHLAADARRHDAICFRTLPLLRRLHARPRPAPRQRRVAEVGVPEGFRPPTCAKIVRSVLIVCSEGPRSGEVPMRIVILHALAIGALLTPAIAQQRACPAPLKRAGGACVAACPPGSLDRGRVCEATVGAPASSLAQGGSCHAPLKIAAGACVAECPGGYEDRGSTCLYRRD